MWKRCRRLMGVVAIIVLLLGTYVVLFCINMQVFQGPAVRFDRRTVVFGDGMDPKRNATEKTIFYPCVWVMESK